MESLLQVLSLYALYYFFFHHPHQLWNSASTHSDASFYCPIHTIGSRATPLSLSLYSHSAIPDHSPHGTITRSSPYIYPERQKRTRAYPRGSVTESRPHSYIVHPLRLIPKFHLPQSEMVMLGWVRSGTWPSLATRSASLFTFGVYGSSRPDGISMRI